MRSRPPACWPAALLLSACTTAPPRVPTAPAPPPRQAAEDQAWNARPFSTVGHDLLGAPRAFAEDLGTTASSPETLLLLSLAGGFAAWSKETGHDAEQWFRDHNALGDTLDDVMSEYGNGGYLLGATAAWYGVSLLAGDRDGYERSKLMLRTLSTTGILTVGIKALDLSTRPDGGSYGFPSGHSSMTAAVATTLQELYGWKVGVPAFALAGLTGLQRLDNQRHDVGDVVFGWTLGYVVAKAISRERMPKVLGLELGLHLDPELGRVGLALRY